VCASRAPECAHKVALCLISSLTCPHAGVSVIGSHTRPHRTIVAQQTCPSTAGVKYDALYRASVSLPWNTSVICYSTLHQCCIPSWHSQARHAIACMYIIAEVVIASFAVIATW
jgi:hypothetical protein